MKILIDKSKCLSCGTCVALAPQIFTLSSKDGKTKLIHTPQSKKEEELARLAVKSCPTGALSISSQKS